MSRKELKIGAKVKIKNNLWTAMIVALIPSINFSILFTNVYSYKVIMPENSSLSANIVITLLNILVSYLTIKFFMKNSKEKANFKDMTDGLTMDRYVNFVKVNLLALGKIILWSLLFIIPGIVKALEYTFISYIKIDHPEYTSKECLELSSKLTSGKKLDILFLYISFIFWYIIAGLTLGILFPYVNAYRSQAVADYYYDLMENN